MAKKKPKKFVYLVKGWTNNRKDLLKIRHFYRYLQKGEPRKTRDEKQLGIQLVDDAEEYKYYRQHLPPHICRKGKIVLKKPYKLIVAENEVTRASTYFNSLLLYHFGLVKATKKNKRDISRSLNDSVLDHKLDNVRVIFGNSFGIGNIGFNKDGNNLKKREIRLHEEWIYEQPIRKVMEGQLRSYLHLTPINPDFKYIPGTKNDGYLSIAVVPGHGRILSGEKALEELVRRGYEPLTEFFRKVVKTYEGRTI